LRVFLFFCCVQVSLCWTALRRTSIGAENDAVALAIGFVCTSSPGKSTYVISVAAAAGGIPTTGSAGTSGKSGISTSVTGLRAAVLGIAGFGGGGNLLALNAPESVGGGETDRAGTCIAIGPDATGGGENVRGTTAGDAENDGERTRFGGLTIGGGEAGLRPTPGGDGSAEASGATAGGGGGGGGSAVKLAFGASLAAARIRLAGNDAECCKRAGGTAGEPGDRIDCVGADDGPGSG